MKKAQDFYINDHLVDIATIWSASTLSLKIWRQNFLDILFNSLSNVNDIFVRYAYFGRSNGSLLSKR